MLAFILGRYFYLYLYMYLCDLFVSTVICICQLSAIIMSTFILGGGTGSAWPQVVFQQVARISSNPKKLSKSLKRYFLAPPSLSTNGSPAWTRVHRWESCFNMIWKRFHTCIQYMIHIGDFILAMMSYYTTQKHKKPEEKFNMERFLGHF